MDPVSALSITSACLSIVCNAGTLIMRITVFVSEVRGARKDLDAVSRELTSLQLCVSALKDDQQLSISALPQGMKTNLNQILVNIQLIVNQISDMLIKLSSGRLGRRIQWAVTERDEMNKFRSSLESDKLALEVALTLGTISMLAKQEQKMTRQDNRMNTLIHRTGEISITTTRISDQLDNLTAMHRNNTNIESITLELAELRSQLCKLSDGITRPRFVNFVKDVEAYEKSLLQPIGVFPSPPPEPSTHSPTSSDPFVDISMSDLSTLEALAGIEACPACHRMAANGAQADCIRSFSAEISQERDDLQAAVEQEQAQTASLTDRIAELERVLQEHSCALRPGLLEPLECHLNLLKSQSKAINGAVAIPLLEIRLAYTAKPAFGAGDRVDLSILSACFVLCENEPDLRFWNRSVTEQLRLLSARVKEQPRLENLEKDNYLRRVKQHLVNLAVETPQAHLFKNERFFLQSGMTRLMSTTYWAFNDRELVGSPIYIDNVWVMLLPRGHKHFDTRTVIQDPLESGVTRVVIDGQDNAYATFQRSGENPSIVFHPTGPLAHGPWPLSQIQPTP